MAVETKAILAAHLTAAQLCAFVETAAPGSRVAARTMNRSEHVVIEVANAGVEMAFDAFLTSWAAGDYHDICAGDSTLLVMNYSPAGAVLLRAMTVLTGGFVMKASGEPWTPIGQHLNPTSGSKH